MSQGPNVTTSRGGLSVPFSLLWKPCSSPLKVKVKKGKHRFGVVATDLAGNLDRTPATDEFKVKRKKHRR